MKNNNKFRLDVWGAITLGTIALYALFLLYPMAYLIRQSVLDPDTGGFTLAYFTKFFSKSYYFDTLINSFKVSITATVLSIAIGKLGRSIQNTIIIPLLALVVIVLLAVLIAYLVVRRRNALTNVVDVLSMIPYIVPGTVLGIALLIGFNKPPLLISGTMLIMVVALIIRRLPYTIRSSVAILQQIPMSIEEAAISLGASKMKAFFRITVPMMASGIISGAILSWVTMISELSTAIILYTGKTKTLTVAIYTEVIRGNYGTAAALSTIMTILTVISLLAFSKLNGGKDISL